MEVRNLTPFPAMGFAAVDPLEQRFHVLVIKQTLTWKDNGQLIYADEQRPLCMVDEFFAEINASSVRQESDLSHYKPKCDVVVNATAHAPGGQSLSRFAVCLSIQTPAHEVLLDKPLAVTGPRAFEQIDVPRHGIIATARKLLDDPLPPQRRWQLSEPAPITSVPLRYEHAFGGVCRINAGDPAAQKLPDSHRLTDEQRIEVPGGDDTDPALHPLAYVADESNPVGMGFAPAWYRTASNLSRIPAPQIELLDAPLTVQRWEEHSNTPAANTEPLGFGIRYRGHPERRKLLGTLDEEFAQGDAVLPEGFDFAMWNCAPSDQQIEALAGNEVITLTNLCAAHSEGARADTEGNTVLQLRLPGDLPFALVRYQSGALGELAAKLDTLLIEPEERAVTCVWRATVSVEPAIRALEARMILREDIEHLREEAAARPTRDLQEDATHGE